MNLPRSKRMPAIPAVSRAICSLALLALLLNFLSTTALAACAPGGSPVQHMQEAPYIFVGTVTRTFNRRTWAHVSVEEVWRGEVPARVQVRGSRQPISPRYSASSEARQFRVGKKYLFAP